MVGTGSINNIVKCLDGTGMRFEPEVAAIAERQKS